MLFISVAQSAIDPPMLDMAFRREKKKETLKWTAWKHIKELTEIGKKSTKIRLLSCLVVAIISDKKIRFDTDSSCGTPARFCIILNIGKLFRQLLTDNFRTTTFSITNTANE